MKILMMTNSYAPMVGGIEESIRSFSAEFEKLGHEVMIVAPECEGAPLDEVGVIRLRAIQNFNNSDFSIALPMSSLLPELIKTFKPDIIHSHYPFWMGSIALRLSGQFKIPLVFTYHTMFEQHMHYLPVQNEGVQRFIVEIFAGYANLANQVVVPSESVRVILLERGVKTPIAVVPTGVDLQRFSRGDGKVVRHRLGIAQDAPLIGYVGRLALEKNLEFLSSAVAAYLKQETSAHFVVGGDGPLKELIQKIFDEQGVGKRLHFAGVLKGQDLVDCYQAMNVFAFASLSETQGIVLVEAMAAGAAVVALDAPGVREVLKDGYNGRLVFGENKNNFVEALSWCLKLPANEFVRIKENAKTTSKEFSVNSCALRMLKTYDEVLVKEYSSPDYKNSPWDALAGRLKNEWDMFKNVLESGTSAIVDTSSLPKPLVKKARGLFLRLPRLLSLSEWSAKLLRLPRTQDTQTDPGLVLIQIDGFSGGQFKKAIEQGKMPFLKGLLQKQYYTLYPQYPGLPSSTPSVQGELFYGVKQIVPAFAFWDRETQKIFRMYDGPAVLEIERRLAAQGQGLLAEGSSYSNIYSGGAMQSHFCATSLGWSKIWKEINPLNFFILILTHFPSFVRMMALTAWEMILGAVDFGWGILRGENFKNEFKFIYLRALICVLLRELVTLGVKIDIVRGLPIIHVNLLGYDELAHHSGPSSTSAHWSLKGIDRAIEKIYGKALHSSARSYDVWIYSDHGQEDTVSYAAKYKRSIEEAVAEVYKEFDATAQFSVVDKTSEQLQRARFLGFSFLEKFFSGVSFPKENLLENKLIVTAIGPTGNIYLPRQMSLEEKCRFAQCLVAKAYIPVVMFVDEQGKVRVWTDQGEFCLPQDAKTILGADHPYLAAVTEDIIALCQHKNAGDFTLMGYQPNKKPMSFPLENGSHAGPAPKETDGFALLPKDIIPRQRTREYITPMDLRFAALRFLKRSVPKENKSYPEIIFPQKSAVDKETIRVMTYNVHSCIGMDGKISPERIARVIGRHQPDIVALQELDLGRKRTGQIDQPQLIAKELEMHYHFHPSVIVDEEHYGNAILSRYPLDLVRGGHLPEIARHRMVERRGAIWATVNIGKTRINFFNTHFGLLPREAILQAQALLGAEWISHFVCQGPVILCGDFNSLPNSQVCRDIKKVLRDAQGELDNHRPKSTWFSHYPIGRIDHVFVSPDIEVTHVEVSRSDLDKLASDHLPLIVDIKLKK